MLKCFTLFFPFFRNLDSVHSSPVSPRSSLKRSMSIMCNKEWELRNLRDIEGNGNKTRHWLCLEPEKRKKLGNSVEVPAQGWVYNEVEKIDYVGAFRVGLLHVWSVNGKDLQLFARGSERERVVVPEKGRRGLWEEMGCILVGDGCGKLWGRRAAVFLQTRREFHRSYSLLLNRTVWSCSMGK